MSLIRLKFVGADTRPMPSRRRSQRARVSGPAFSRQGFFSVLCRPGPPLERPMFADLLEASTASRTATPVLIRCGATESKRDRVGLHERDRLSFRR